MKILSMINDYNIEDVDSGKDDADVNDCNLQPVWWFEEKEEDGWWW